MTSAIGGQCSGSKYRTHNGSFAVYMRFWGPGGVPNLWKDFPTQFLPGC